MGPPAAEMGLHFGKGAALFLGLFLGGCAPASSVRSPVVLITLDTTRADAVGAYGGPTAARTPNLDELAARGVLFEAVTTVAPLTLPAHASMLTGLVPLRHGIRDNAFAQLPSSATTLAEVARGRGYRTGAFVASAVLREEFGLDQGFEVYSAPRPPEGAEAGNAASRPGEEVVGEALAWLDSLEGDHPFFLWVHLFEPHAPYEPPAELLALHEGDAYRAEVAWADRILAPLLRRIEAGPSATVLVVADHGEGLGEHGERTHGFFAYQGTLAVPMILVRADGARAGERVSTLASVVDVAPTLASAMGAALPSGIDGVDLFESPPPPDRGAYFEAYAGWLAFGWSSLAGWRIGPLKYIHTSKPELYDLDADPNETENLYPEGAVAACLQALRNLEGRPRLQVSIEEGSSGALEAVRALGYTASGGPLGTRLPPPSEPSEGRSPHDGASELEGVQWGTTLLKEGRFDEALAAFDEVLAGNPANSRALYLRATALMRMGREAEAAEPLERALRRHRPVPRDWYNLAICQRAAGRMADAFSSFERALTGFESPPPWFEAALHLLEEAGETARAARWRQRFGRSP